MLVGERLEEILNEGGPGEDPSVDRRAHASPSHRPEAVLTSIDDMLRVDGACGMCFGSARLRFDRVSQRSMQTVDERGADVGREPRRGRAHPQRLQPP